jgi:hypothetical protein
MASDDKKAKATPAPKKETPVADKSAAADKTVAVADSPKVESSEKVADPSKSYSRGEGQKPVSKAYKDNWNVIFGKKKKR